MLRLSLIILKFLIKNLETIKLGNTYLSVVALSYLATAISFSYSFGARSIGEAKLPAKGLNQSPFQNADNP